MDRLVIHCRKPYSCFTSSFYNFYVCIIYYKLWIKWWFSRSGKMLVGYGLLLSQINSFLVMFHTFYDFDFRFQNRRSYSFGRWRNGIGPYTPDYLSLEEININMGNSGPKIRKSTIQIQFSQKQEKQKRQQHIFHT